MELKTFGIWKQPALWHELAPEAWSECGAPRREKATPAKTDYFGEERRYLGRPVEGLRPLEDACKRIARACKRIQEAQALHRENEALRTARAYDRLYADIGYYAKDMLMESESITRDELDARLALASAVMLEKWA